MGEISRARLLHVVGGLLGIASFFLPWVALSAGTLRRSLTPVDMIAIALQSFLVEEPLADVLLVGLVLAAAGLLFLLVASGITLVSPYGGPLMLMASAISSVGLTVITYGVTTFVPVVTPFTPAVYTVDYGALLAFLAAILAIVGLLYHRAESLGQTESGPPAPELPGGND